MLRKRTGLAERVYAQRASLGLILLGGLSLMGWFLHDGAGLAFWVCLCLLILLCMIGVILGSNSGGFEEWSFSHPLARALLLLGIFVLPVIGIHLQNPRGYILPMIALYASLYVANMLRFFRRLEQRKPPENRIKLKLPWEKT